MRVQRIIHPVGQGAFYSERFFDNEGITLATVVYDCGSKTLSSDLLKKRIKDYFLDKEEIDILFLSHLHVDHINGIKSLKNYATIKHVVLPYSRDDKELLYFQYKHLEKGTPDSDVLALISDPVAYFADSKVLYVDEADFGQLRNSANDIVTNIESVELSHLSGGTKISTTNLNDAWVYIPINNNYSKYHNDFRQIVLDVAKEFDIKDFKFEDSTFSDNFIKEVKKRIKDKEISSEINANSLIVYSGPYRVEENTSFYPAGCLYTGDSCFRYNAYIMNHVQTSLNDYLPDLGLIQVPHHGSRGNFSTDMFDIGIKCHVYFLSHGICNMFAHPSINVLKHFHLDKRNKIYYNNNTVSCISSGNRLFCVNEIPDSALILDYSL